MRQYIIKSYEEELGEEFWIVKVPNGVSHEEAYKVFEMAEKYAHYMDTSLDIDEGIAEYDEHYEVMAEEYENSQGQEAFNVYLELHGFEVESMDYDFEYEW